MLTKLYQWTLAKAAHPHAERWLFAISFMESSFFPIPPHPLLGLMCLARPERAIRFGLICTIASVMGGILGYAIGHRPDAHTSELQSLMRISYDVSDLQKNNILSPA